MKLSAVANVLRAKLLGPDCEFRNVSTDSRHLQSGELFVALRGENFDGHAFVANAVASGACGVVVDQPVELLAVPQLVVADTTKALGQIGHLNRSRFQGTVVALTGSSGKTSVKNMLLNICSQLEDALATEGNFNNHIGVPLTLMRLKEQRFAIIEAGTSGIGEIEYLTDLIEPDIALVNNIMAAHIEGFGSVDAIANEKSAIYGSVRTKIGILNLDDKFHSLFEARLQGKRLIGFSASETTDVSAVVQADKYDCLVTAEKPTLEPSGCYSFTLNIAGSRRRVLLGVPGRHNLSNAVAAAAAAAAMEIPIDNVVVGLQAYRGTPGRMQIVESIRCRQLVNDSYNANPGSMCAAIDYLAEFERSVLVMGDMGELGDEDIHHHEAVGRYAKSKKIQALYATGILSQHAVKAFGVSGLWFETKADLVKHLNEQDLEKSVVLVKGSRYTKMEDVVCQLQNNNEVAKC